MSSPSKRREMDVMKLMMSDYSVEPINDGISELKVEFHGPKDSKFPCPLYATALLLLISWHRSDWWLLLHKPTNINLYGDEAFTKEVSGKFEWSCQMLTLTSLLPLGLLTKYSTPMLMSYLLNIFEVFLPQLLLYPNPSDPLNGDAASLMMKDQKQYEQRVKEYCERYAKKENITDSTLEDSDEDISNDDISDEQSTSSDDNIVGDADP